MNTVYDTLTVGELKNILDNIPNDMELNLEVQSIDNGLISASECVEIIVENEDNYRVLTIRATET